MAKKKIVDYRGPGDKISNPKTSGGKPIAPSPSLESLLVMDHTPLMDATGRANPARLMRQGYPYDFAVQAQDVDNGMMQRQMQRQHHADVRAAGGNPWANPDGSLKKGWAIGKDGRPFRVDEYGRPLLAQ